MCEIKEKAQKSRLFYVKIGIVCLTVFVSCLAYIADYYWKQAQAELTYNQMQQEYEVPVVRIVENAEDEPEEEAVDLSLRKENQINFDELHKKNQDIYAWIEIPGTKVDYPILQHPDDDAYYLNHTVDRISGLPGSIYSEAVFGKDFSSTQTILYGHNMKNGSMFGSLHRYEDKEFFEENPYIYIYSEDKTLLYQIFASVKFSDAYLPSYCDYNNAEEFNHYVQEIKQSPGNLNENIEVKPGDRILTLSTCVANEASCRFLVEAVLIDEYE